MPSFAIEAPAEANPLTHEQVYRVLVSASSKDPTQIQTGTKQLQNWENVEGFHSFLQTIYLDVSLPFEVRYLAIIQLKNAVEKRWKRGAQRPISNQEKTVIRSRCIDSVLNEPEEKLALQSSIFTAKVLRSDVQRDWADPVEDILARLEVIWKQDPFSFRLSRALLLMLHVVKELSSARLGVHQRTLRSLAATITESVYSVYADLANKWIAIFHVGGDHEGSALNSVETSLLALRILRRLLIVGYEYPNRHTLVCEIWPQLIGQLGEMLEFVSSGPNLPLELQGRPRVLVELHLMQMSKLHLNMTKGHPAAFVLLPNSVELVKSYWNFAEQFGQTYGNHQSKNLIIGTDGDNDDEDAISFAERFALKGLLLLKGVSQMVFQPVRSFKYPNQTDIEERNQAVNVMKNGLMTADFARHVMETVMARFFVFTPRDLKQWEEEPDEWEKTQEGMGEDWEFTIRVCAEKLFLDMIHNYKDELIDRLIERIWSTTTSGTNDVWLKDSVYAAIGLSAQILYDKFPFEDFLKNTLVVDVQTHQPDYNIIRRRVAIVLSQWVPAKDGLDRPLIYEIFQHLLDKGDTLNDEVVRVTAGRKLGDIVDPFDFTPQGFAPYAATIIQKLVGLIHEAQLSETKLALMNTLHLVVVKMEQHISPFGDQILSVLPPMWDSAEGNLQIKEMILGILSGLVTSMKGQSRKYHDSLAPLVASSTNMSGNSDEMFLAEEALNLWSSILDETVSPVPQSVGQLLSNLMAMLEIQSEMLDHALGILDSYIYLMPIEVIGNSSHIFSKFVPILGGRRREPVGQITQSLDLIFRSTINLGGVPALNQVISDLITSDFLPTMLIGLRDAYEAHQSTGPKRKIASIDGIVEIDYLSVLSRIAIASPELLVSAYQMSIPNLSIDWLLEEWFSHIDNISHPNRKKLACLALTAFLDTNEPWILNKLQLLMTMWTSVLTELEDLFDDGSQQGTMVRRDCLVYTPEYFQKLEYLGPNVERARDLDKVDPIHALDTRAFIRERLANAVRRNGGNDTFTARWVANVDNEIVKAFSELEVF